MMSVQGVQSTDMSVFFQPRMYTQAHSRTLHASQTDSTSVRVTLTTFPGSPSLWGHKGGLSPLSGAPSYLLPEQPSVHQRSRGGSTKAKERAASPCRTLIQLQISGAPSISALLLPACSHACPDLSNLFCSEINTAKKQA